MKLGNLSGAKVHPFTYVNEALGGRRSLNYLGGCSSGSVEVDGASYFKATRDVFGVDHGDRTFEVNVCSGVVSDLSSCDGLELRRFGSIIVKKDLEDTTELFYRETPNDWAFNFGSFARKINEFVPESNIVRGVFCTTLNTVQAKP
jgi:hypothetical protein